MCEISGISDEYADWDDPIDKRGESIAELNGHKHKMTILEQDANLAAAIYKPNLYGYNLRNHYIANIRMLPMKIEGSVEAGFTASWGDKDGVKYSASGRLEVNDDNGNYIKAEANQDNSGNGQVEVIVGHTEEGE